MIMDRRQFVKNLLISLAGLWVFRKKKNILAAVKSTPTKILVRQSVPSDVFLIRNGTPEENMSRLIDLMGGIESIIGREDIVIIKPNSQWWLQGMTNTDSMAALIQIILDIPNFKGEIIIADNHQFQDDNSRGWTTLVPNGRFNLNQLVEYFQKAGYKNVTKYHWHDGGSNPSPMQGDAFGDSVVSGPEAGDGYVWDENNYYLARNGNKCVMTYPIMTSSYSGITIDLKNGAFENGKYTEQPVKFVNMPSLNHHGAYCGVTASVKNLMGVVDMSCGFPAPQPKETFNTHYVGLTSPFWERFRRTANFHWRARDMMNRFLKETDLVEFHHTGGALGYWIQNVRKPDLSIITADWVGYGSRIVKALSARPKALVASTDPVAADFIAAQKVLLPVTKEHAPKSRYVQLNDPDNPDGPFYKFLEYAARECGGNRENSSIRVIES
ncbi:MAG: DUF362 domain-containing protein [candidate division Zixibacteria bacterium]